MNCAIFASGAMKSVTGFSLAKALVYGAGSSGRQLVSALSNSYEMRVVGFLDDDDRLHMSMGNQFFYL